MEAAKVVDWMAEESQSEPFSRIEWTPEIIATVLAAYKVQAYQSKLGE